MRKNQAILAAAAFVALGAIAGILANDGLTPNQAVYVSADDTANPLTALPALGEFRLVAASAAPVPINTGTSKMAASRIGEDRIEVAQAAGSLPGIVREQYGDWQLSCDTPPGASFEQCAIIQNVTAEDQPNVGLSVIVLKTADNKARLLRVLAPLGVLLPNGLGLNIDGTDMGRVAFVRCLPNGCIAEVVMDDALIDTLSKGATAIFIVFKTPEEGIGIPVSLNGFSAGYEALP